MDTYNSKYYEPLEQMMAIRHQYMSKILRDYSGQDIYEFFKNKKILDLGCGTGEFLNNYYGVGAECSGIDIENNFKIKNKINFKLINIEANKFLKNCKKKFDVILNMEIVEHVEDIHEFICQSVKFLKDDGIMFIATLNQTLKSYVFAIIGAEYILRWLPIGTHDWNKFIKPEELESKLTNFDISIQDVKGLTFNPINQKWKQSKDTSVNYILTGSKN